MSIVRVGMSEDDKFAEGYEAIFGKKTKKKPAKAEAKKDDKKPADAKKPTGKKK